MVARKYHIITLGCQMNWSDSERIAAVLEKSGFLLAGSEEEADLIIINACSVRQKAVDRILGKNKQWLKLKKKNPGLRIILTGCVLPKDKKKIKKRGIVDLIFDIKGLKKLPYELQVLRNCSYEHDNRVQTVNGEERCDYLEITPNHKSSFQALVPIMTGCNNFCTYCAVPYTRGREVSRSKDEIVKEVRQLVKEGYKEIVLLGQNVNSYIAPRIHGSTADSADEKGSHFVDLCRKIDKIPGEFWVRFMSSNPYNFADELIDFLSKSKHFCKGIHIAIQSGDDEILKKMNRRCSSKDIEKLMKKIRKKIHDVTLTTDVIVGFCGESEKAFNNTLDLVKQARFSQIFIGQYSPRPGTVAAKMFKDDVAPKVKIDRDKKLNVILRNIAKKENERFIGRTMKVLVEGKKKGQLFGRIEQGIGIIFEGADSLIGKFANVKVKEADSFGTQGTWSKPELVCHPAGDQP